MNSRHSNPSFPHIVTSLALPLPPEQPVTMQKGTPATGHIPPGFTNAVGLGQSLEPSATQITAEQSLLPFHGRNPTDYQGISHNLLWCFQAAFPVHSSPRTKSTAHLYCSSPSLKGPGRDEGSQKGETQFGTCQSPTTSEFRATPQPQCFLLCLLQQPHTNTPFRPRLLTAFPFTACSVL